MSTRVKTVLLGAVVFGAVALAYSNHFQNGFHFDDFHSITDNVFVRDLRNIPRFFTDAATSTVLPANRSWRPLVMTSLAADYWLAGGYHPFYFHLSTFLWFLAQLACMYWLFTTILNRTRPDAANVWVAWFAVAWYGLHPAMAETVNYIVQRADLMSTCGVVAGIALYAGAPKLRRYHLYLLPVAVALLAKPPAVVFPALLLAYIVLFEDGWAPALRKVAPAAALPVAYAALQAAVIPRTFTPGGFAPYLYHITQPYVAFRYFVSFFLPTHLSADTDLAPLPSLWTLEAMGGMAFLAALLFAIRATARSRAARPIAFGLVWFLLALLPTALLPLAEVENDHRMFFPFVGLVLAVTWAGALLLPRPLTREARAAIAAGAACLLLLSAWGTRRRNEVWRTEESLWEDVTFKSPRNGRGLMNYGLTLMGRGQFQDALNLFERARAYTPDYSVLEINMGIACGALGRNDEAGRHFQRARWLAPDSADPYYYCGRWRKQNGQVQSAAEDLKRAIALNPAYMPARILLLDTYAQLRQLPELRALAADTLKIAPEDATARRYLSGPSETPESLLELSLIRYRASDYPGCLDAAERALKMRPAYAEAYNNIASAHAAMGHWDDAIRAARQAIRLRPDFQLAKNNLAWAESEKRKLGRTGSQ